MTLRVAYSLEYKRVERASAFPWRMASLLHSYTHFYSFDADDLLLLIHLTGGNKKWPFLLLRVRPDRQWTERQQQFFVIREPTGFEPPTRSNFNSAWLAGLQQSLHWLTHNKNGKRETITRESFHKELEIDSFYLFQFWVRRLLIRVKGKHSNKTRVLYRLRIFLDFLYICTRWFVECCHHIIAALERQERHQVTFLRFNFTTRNM